MLAGWRFNSSDNVNLLVILHSRLILCLAVLVLLVFTPEFSVLATELKKQPFQTSARVPCSDYLSQSTANLQFINLLQSEDCLLPVDDFANSISGSNLPDLRTLPPTDLKIVKLPDGSYELRLSNTIWNNGAGRLELKAVNNSSSRTSSVEQVIYNGDELQSSNPVGEFIWHPAHDHFHFEDFSIYELWAISSSGKLDRLLSTSGKLSYCVIDTDIVNREVEGFSPYKRFGGCGQKLQGLSIGWGDTYESHLDGQSIALPAMPDGVYALKSTVNPDGLLLEASYQNNDSVIYLDIAGKIITRISESEFLERLCQESSAWMVAGLTCSF